MRTLSGGSLITMLALLAGGTASAEWRCDCTSIVGSCSASAVVRDSFVEVTSNVQQCARVDYFIDGIPFVALVVDGTERQDWIAQSASPAVIIQSCQVCMDNSGDEPAPAAGSSLISEGEPIRLISVDPVYPPAAAAAGVEGWVDVHFEVSAGGTVTAPRVVAAEPGTLFNDAAIAAVSRWRYTVPPAGESRELTERVEFDLDDAIFALNAARPVERQPGAASETRRNDCVREETRFDFGAAVDVSLINACAEPLLVYSCAAGTGADRNRWVCRDPEVAMELLQPSIGAAVTPAAAAGMDDIRRLEITRAPNGEHWWLACSAGDADCRASGRSWIRAMDRQVANVDPQDRTRARLARSY